MFANAEIVHTSNLIEEKIEHKTISLYAYLVSNRLIVFFS